MGLGTQLSAHSALALVGPEDKIKGNGIPLKHAAYGEPFLMYIYTLE